MISSQSSMSLPMAGNVDLRSSLSTIAEVMGMALIAEPDGAVVAVGSALATAFNGAGTEPPALIDRRDCRRALRNPNGVRIDRSIGAGDQQRFFRVRLRRLELFGAEFIGCRYEEATTERRWAERRGLSADRSEQLLSVISDYVFETDAAGVIQLFSVRTQSRDALEATSLEGRGLWDVGRFVAHPDYPRARPPRPRQRAPLRRCLWQTSSGDGADRFLEINAIPVFDRRTDTFLGFHGSAVDLTTRLLAQADARAFQAQLTAALNRLEEKNRELTVALEAAQSSDRAKSEFLAMMSHELRTPLNAIIGFAEMMQAQIFGPLGNDRYQAYMGDVLGSAQHLLSVINDILDYAKFQSGQMPIELAPTDMAELVGEACRFIALQADVKHIGLSRRVCGDPTWSVDPRRLKQVLINILSNAVKFTPEGGTVDLMAFVGADGDLFVEVTDTGPGIPEDQVQRVLEPFVQADARLSRTHEGTGLGLPIARMIVEAHGGRLAIKSGETCCTTVTITLPPGPA